MQTTTSLPAINRITLALPAYNEAASIRELIDQAAQVLQTLGIAWEIIVVDDGSADDTAAIVTKATADYPQVRLVQHPKNRGLGPAIMTCILSSLELGNEADHLVVTMDADVTHPPATIPSMIERANQGADFIIASRYQPGSEQHGVPPFRVFMSWGARLLFKWFLAVPGVRDYTCGFRAIRASVLQAAIDRFGEDGLITRSGFACTDEILVKLATLRPRIEEVPFILRYDLKQGVSKINLGVTIWETLKLLMAHRRQLKRFTKQNQ